MRGVEREGKGGEGTEGTGGGRSQGYAPKLET